ncbi:MAG: C45 family peptidase [Planctomycetota bacterium]
MTDRPNDRFRGLTRRDVLRLGALSALGATGLRTTGAAERRPLAERPQAAPHSLETISGSPRERGRAYGQRFSEEIRRFLDVQIYAAFAERPAEKDELLRYAGACLEPIRQLSTELVEELEGLAEGSGLGLEEHVLIALHEELWHRGVIPSTAHCTAIAVGPPDTRDGKTFVAESWDWMVNLYGTSRMLLWERADGPSVLSYSYPGLWIGAGVNSAGIALCWTSAPDKSIPGPAVGVPSYLLIAHLLYQPSLEAVEEEAKRAAQAGWFTFVMADGDGRLLNIEGSPKRVVTEWGRGTMARVYYGTREMTGTPAGQPVPRHPQCARMLELLAGAKGRLDRATLEASYADHESTICKHFGTLDVVLFDATERVAHVTRGPGCLGQWQSFRFPP